MTVHFIGAGPGAADLLTIRAVALIRSSPVCVYAGTYIGSDVLAHCPAEVTLVDSQHLDLDQITERLIAAHRAGQDVAAGRADRGLAEGHDRVEQAREELCAEMLVDGGHVAGEPVERAAGREDLLMR